MKKFFKSLFDKKYYQLCENNNEQKILCDTKENLYNYKSGKWTSMSCIYSTKKELFKDLGILKDRCKICGNLVTTNYIEPTRTRLIENNLCFSCDIWDERVKKINNSNIFIINHEYYIDGGSVDRSNNKNGWGLGFGGRLWTIKKNNIMITTNNLWHGGDIPKIFWDKLPNNAEFIF